MYHTVEVMMTYLPIFIGDAAVLKLVVVLGKECSSIIV
jgi:hypothetical protein